MALESIQFQHDTYHLELEGSQSASIQMPLKKADDYSSGGMLPVVHFRDYLIDTNGQSTINTAQPCLDDVNPHSWRQQNGLLLPKCL